VQRNMFLCIYAATSLGLFDLIDTVEKGKGKGRGKEIEAEEGGEGTGTAPIYILSEIYSYDAVHWCTSISELDMGQVQSGPPQGWKNL